MAVVRDVMRIFSYVYHGILALFLLAVSAMALAGGSYSLNFEMLPWEGRALVYWLFFGALFGLISVYLAIKRKAPLVFFVWSLAVLLLMMKGYFLSGYYFEPGEFTTTAWLMLGAVLAMAGAWFQLRRPERRKL